jgi:tetratricopeptide (TPR) repeat protein
MEFIVEAHLLAARQQLVRGDPQAALAEADSGLLHAVSCGYGLLQIELLVALARIRLAWPGPPQAIQAAREALDLAADPACAYAWGEADAAQAWGESFFSNREYTLARRAFVRTLELRRRIEHPGTAETERWLARAHDMP